MKRKESKSKTPDSPDASDNRPQGQLSFNTRRAESAYRVWGLTGGAASGKSTAARLFSEEGIAVVDADEIARELSKEGGIAHPAIQQRFGTADRVKLRELIFSDPAARKDLEAILHPLIRTESLRAMRAHAVDQLKSKAPLPMLYEAALLVETGRYVDFEGLIVVSAPSRLRLDRLRKRDGLTGEMAQSILDSQLPDEKRRAAATVVLENAGTLEELQENVRKITKRLKGTVS